MRSLPSVLNNNMNLAAQTGLAPGSFTRAYAPTSYLTVQTLVQSGGYGQSWWLNTVGSGVGDADPATLPYRWFVDQAGTFQETQIPNLKQLIFNDSLTSDAPTLQAQILSVNPDPLASVPGSSLIATISTTVPINETLVELPVTSTSALTAGQTILIGWQGHTQQWTVSENTAYGSTVIPVDPQEATYAFPPGSGVVVKLNKGTAPWVINQPGYLSWYYGGNPDTTNNYAETLWGQVPNPLWQDTLRENALIRWYFGYGGVASNDVFQEIEAGTIMLKGVFLVDTVSIESETGLITLTCRGIGGKLTLDTVLYPPLVPPDFYTSSGIEFYPPIAIPYGAQSNYGATDETNPILTKSSKENFPLTVTAGAVASSGLAYALVGSDGRVFAYSNEIFGYGGLANIGDEGQTYLVAPIIGIQVTNNGEGYWIADADGNIYGYGNAAGSGTATSSLPSLVKPATITAGTFIGSTTVITQSNSALTYVQSSKPAETASIAQGTYTPSQLLAAVQQAAPDLNISLNNSNELVFSTEAGGKDATLQITGGGAASLLGITTPTAVAKGTSPGSTTNDIVAFAVTADGQGYYLLDSVGHVYTAGDAISAGSTTVAVAPAVGIAVDSATGGYLVLDSGGNVYAFGAPNYGGVNVQPPQVAAAIATTPDGGGYWVVTNTPVVNSNNPTGTYWQANVFAFGDAQNYSIKGAASWPEDLNAPITSIVSSADGNGFYLVGADGGIFTFGDADYYGSLPASYTQWIASNYVSPYNTDVYVDLPPGTAPPPNSTVTIAPDGEESYTSPTLLAPDYSQIVRIIWAWCGGYFPPSIASATTGVGGGKILYGATPTSVAANTPPPLLGAIFDSGAYDALGPLDSSTFDKVPPKQAINNLATAIGYIVRWRDDGGIFFGLPNIWFPGNFLEDKSYTYTTAIPEFNEYWIQDFVLTATDQNLRSTIIVSPVDPYLYDGSPPFPNENPLPEEFSSTVTYYVPATNQLNIMHGIPKVAFIGVPLNVPITPADQDYMAELQGYLCWVASRTGQLQSIFRPDVTLDTQIRIFERVTATTDIHYVTGISVTHNLDQGDCLCTYTTNWLGDTDGWINTGSGTSTITNQTFNPQGQLVTNQSFAVTAATLERVQAAGPILGGTNNPTGYALFTN